MRVYKRSGYYWLTTGSGAQRIRAPLHRLHVKLTGLKILPVRDKASAEVLAAKCFNILNQPRDAALAVDLRFALMQYLQHCYREQKESTVRTKRLRLESFLRATRINSLADLTTPAIQRYLLGLDCTPRSRNRNLTVISGWCEFCQLNGWLAENPAVGVKRERETRGAIGQFITHQQLDALQMATDPCFAAILEIAYHTGWRQGEIHRLWREGWKDVNSKFRKAKLVDTKNRRTIELPITQEAADAIRKIEKLACRAPATPHGISQKFRRLRARLGMTCRFHDFRVTFSTRLHEAGVPESAIMRLLNQLTPKLSIIAYTSHEDRFLRSALDKL